jgi:drug/metabolite transporter (DMT)-like permease
VGVVPLLLVLGSALLHASWNLVVKSASDRLIAAWAQAVFGGLVFLPILLVEGVPVRVLPAVVGSGLVHLLYGLTLVAAYDRGELSLVYPVARGVAPILVTGAAALFLHDVPSGGGLLAIACVVAGVLWVARGRDHRGLGWALATGATIAAYTTIDGASVRTLGTALAYTGAVFVANAIWYLPVIAVRRSRRQVIASVQGEWWRQLFAGAASIGAYALVLTAARFAPLGLVAALRETSVLFGAVGGWLILKEPEAKQRLRGATLIAVGLAVLVLFA